MKVFKTYFTVLKNGAFVVILINIAIAFAVFSLFKLNPESTDNSFESKKPLMTVYNNDNSEFSKEFVGYLNKNARLVNIENNKDSRLDALFYRKTAFFLTIPQGFGKSIENGNMMKLQTQYLPDMQNASYCEMLVNNYMTTYQTYKSSTNLSTHEIAEKISKVLSLQTKVTVENTVKTNYSQKSLFYNCANYVIMTLLINCIALLASSFNNKEVK